MSWFDSSFATFAKSALSTAQKTLDKALEIQQQIDAKPESPKGSEQFLESHGREEKEASFKEASKKSSKWNGKDIGGFWNEWGSLFGEQDSSKNLKENVEASTEAIKTTVRSQPQRSKLFPPESSEQSEPQSLESPQIKNSEPIQQQPSKTSIPVPSLTLSEERMPNIKDLACEKNDNLNINEDIKELMHSNDDKISSQKETTPKRNNILSEGSSEECIVQQSSDNEILDAKDFQELPLEKNSETDVTLKVDTSEAKKELDPIAIVEEEELAEVKDFEIKSIDSAASLCTSSSSSFIKCCVEDVESNRETTPNSGPASDCLKPEIYGHTSSEETSSDIEIISLPSGGELGRHCSPHKHTAALPKKSRRSESPGSESSMPVVPEQEENIMLSISDQDRETPEYQEPFDSQEHLLRNIHELQEILEIREKKVLDLSKENSSLQEINATLENKIKSLEESYSNETKEFAKRMAQMEQTLQILTQDRNKYKSQLDTTLKEFSSKPNIQELQELLKEKEIQISELMKEGEALSKQQLQYSNAIKKLRAKEKETENTLKSLRDKLEDADKEIERLRKSLDAKDEQEEKHIEIVGKLNQALSKKDKEVSQLQSELEDAREKYASLKNTLDDTYNQLSHFLKAKEEQENKAQELALSCELAAQAKLHEALEASNQEKETLMSQVYELQQNLVQAEKESAQREATLNAQIASLQERLQDIEKQTQELTLQVGSANLPLLQQIEHLQKALHTGRTQWEKTEQELLSRLEVAEKTMSHATQRESHLQGKVHELEAELTTLRAQHKITANLNATLSSQLHACQLELALKEETTQRDKKDLENLKNSFAEQIAKLKQEKEALENRLQIMEQHQLISNEESDWWDKESVREVPSEVPIPPASDVRSVSPSRFSSVSEWHEEGNLMTLSKMSLYDSVKHTSVFEGLHTQLKLREGEIAHLQSEVRNLEKMKEALLNEVTSLSRQNEKLHSDLSTLRDLKPLYQELEQRYNTLLQMFGEKAEQVEELQLDLQDVKTMYRNQIDELMRKK